jgi:hypothetical protein
MSGTVEALLSSSQHSDRLWSSRAAISFYRLLLQCQPPAGLVVGQEVACGEDRRLGKADWDAASLSARVGTAFDRQV